MPGPLEQDLRLSPAIILNKGEGGVFPPGSPSLTDLLLSLWLIRTPVRPQIFVKSDPLAALIHLIEETKERDGIGFFCLFVLFPETDCAHPRTAFQGLGLQPCASVLSRFLLKYLQAQTPKS